jgi:hypothetical protein
MDLKTLGSELEALEGDMSLEIEQNLNARANALNFIALVREFARWHTGDKAVISVQRRAETLKQHLLAINEQLYQRLRKQIRSGNCNPQDLRRELDQYTGYHPGQKNGIHIGPDGLDVLVSGIFGSDVAPVAPEIQHPDMVHYEPVPARVVLDLIDNANLQPDDIFYDLGSGLGQVVILVNRLSGIKARGIEIDSVLCDQARNFASPSGGGEVAFIHADARDADYSDGTVFYLFTPFKGMVLQTVLDKLQQESQKRKIKLCTYGACTLSIATQPWLRSIYSHADHEFKLAIFESI